MIFYNISPLKLIEPEKTSKFATFKTLVER